MQRKLLLRAHGPILIHSMIQSPGSSAEKDRARSRAVDLDVAIRAIRVLCVQVVLRTCGFICADTVRDAVTGQTELCDAARSQQAWIGRAVWRVTRNAPFSLNGGMLINKRSLFVSVTLDARSIGAGRQSRLFQLKSAVWVVAIAASHRTFEHFVMERQVELVLRFAVTTEAKLWLALFQ